MQGAAEAMVAVLEHSCAKCRAFFARFTCAAAMGMECDCPKCQGYCECKDMTDDIELPPLPEVSYVERDTASTEYGLWCTKHGPYGPDDMHAYARAAVIADREKRVVALEPAAWQYLYSDGLWRFSNGEMVNGGAPVQSRPLYAAPPPTPPADARATVEVERGRVWIKRGVQSWMLAYKEDEPAAVEWYAQTLRAALEGK